MASGCHGVLNRSRRRCGDIGSDRGSDKAVKGWAHADGQTERDGLRKPDDGARSATGASSPGAAPPDPMAM